MGTDVGGRLAQAKHMASHLQQLGQILHRSLRSQDLLSVAATIELRNRLMKVNRQPRWRHVTEFSQLSGESFGTFVRRLAGDTRARVYIWTPSTNVCGALPPVSLLDIAFDFPFSINPEGIISFLTDDGLNELLLDFSHESSGEVVEIEGSGELWGRTAYASDIPKK